MGAPPDDEAAWIERSRAGDHAAFASLIRLHQRMIHSLAYRMTGSAADADDVAQEAFVRCHAQLATYQGAAKFSTWLYQIALRTAINWRKRERRRQEIHNAWFAASEAAAFPDSSCDADQDTREVRSALLRLPPKQRAAIILTVYEERSHADAARLLKCTEATVSWRVFSARGKLKRWLSKPGGIDGRR